MTSRFTILKQQNLIHIQTSGTIQAHDLIKQLEHVYEHPSFHPSQDLVVDLTMAHISGKVTDWRQLMQHACQVAGLWEGSQWAFITLQASDQEFLSEVFYRADDCPLPMDVFATLDASLRWFDTQPSSLGTPAVHYAD